MKQLLFLVALMLWAYAAPAQVYVLGIAQDGGYPHAGCTKKCCTMAWEHSDKRRYVTSLALVDSVSGKWWLFEATPDITEQLWYFSKLTGGKYSYLPSGIFITHAHIGHYTGLMQLGREVMGTKEMPVYVMPKMKKFLKENGPWSQLVSLGNIRLMDVYVRTYTPQTDEIKYNLAPGVGVSAFTVPHRDEYSETAGFDIQLHSRSYLFIPDIDKWEKWRKDIKDHVNGCDIALIDGTFYRDGELPNRSMSEVPHPFVEETMTLFKNRNGARIVKDVTQKIHFIHFNHTNPLMWDDGIQKEVRDEGFNIAVQGQKL